MDAFDAKIDSLVKEAKENPHAGIIMWVQRHILDLPASRIDPITAALAEGYRIPESRVRKLYLLHSYPELAAALEPTFPTLERKSGEDVYPTTGWIGQYLLNNQETEAPLGFHFWCACAILSTISRRNIYWNRGWGILYLNQYYFLLGHSAIKKSLAIERAEKMLEVLMERLRARNSVVGNEVYISPNRVTPEKFIANLISMQKVDPEQRDKHSKEYTPQKDTTALVLADELVTMFGQSVRGSDRMVHFLTAVYGKGKYVDDTHAHNEKRLENLAVNALLGSTEEWVRTSVTESMFSGGFMGRFVIAPRPGRNRFFPDGFPIDPVVRLEMAEALIPWITLGRHLELKRTPLAKEWYHDWYMSRPERWVGDAKMQGYQGRKSEHLHKLAGVLALSEVIPSSPTVIGQDTIEVGLETFQQALHLLELEEALVPTSFAEIGATDEAQEINTVETIIAGINAKGKPATYRLVLKGARVHTHRLPGIIKSLEDRGSIAGDKEKGWWVQEDKE